MVKSIFHVATHLKNLVRQESKENLIFSKRDKKISRLFTFYLVISNYYLKFQLEKIYTKNELFFLTKKESLNLNSCSSVFDFRTEAELLNFPKKDKDNFEILMVADSIELVWDTFINSREMFPSFYFIDCLKILRHDLKKTLESLQGFSEFTQGELVELKEQLFTIINENLKQLIQFFYVRESFLTLYKKTESDLLFKYSVFDLIFTMDGYLVNSLQTLFTVIIAYSEISKKIKN